MDLLGRKSGGQDRINDPIQLQTSLSNGLYFVVFPGAVIRLEDYNDHHKCIMPSTV